MLWEPQPQTKRLQGIIASLVTQETVEGQVRVLRSSREGDQFRKGEILVTAMTSPDYMPIMRKAVAIITDEGGLTAHAAVVSRELGIPCIVGTKVATKLLKTGDHIKMNLQTGEIEKINN